MLIVPVVLLRLLLGGDVSPAAVGPECLCTQQACCRAAQAAAPSCHRAAPPASSAVVRCAHGFSEWTLHVTGSAPVPARLVLAGAPGPVLPLTERAGTGLRVFALSGAGLASELPVRA